MEKNVAPILRYDGIRASINCRSFRAEIELGSFVVYEESGTIHVGRLLERPAWNSRQVRVQVVRFFDNLP